MFSGRNHLADRSFSRRQCHKSVQTQRNSPIRPANRARQEADRCDLVLSLEWDDLQEMQSTDEGAEGSHLPQETKVAMPPMQPGPDAVSQEDGVSLSLCQPTTFIGCNVGSILSTIALTITGPGVLKAAWMAGLI